MSNPIRQTKNVKLKPKSTNFHLNQSDLYFGPAILEFDHYIRDQQTKYQILFKPV